MSAATLSTISAGVCAPLRIAIWHNLPSGGGKRALHDQVRGLVSMRHHVEIWCPPTADQEFLPLSKIAPEHIVPLLEPRALAGPFKSLRQLTHDSCRRMAMMETHCRECAAQIASGGFDVLLAHPCRFFRANPLAGFLSIPTVLYLQEPFRELYEAWPRLAWIGTERSFHPLSRAYWTGALRDLAALQNKRFQARKELLWVAQYSELLVNSFFSRESLLRAYNLDSRVCYLGVDPTRFSTGGSSKKNCVIGLGNFHFNKRPLLAIQAIGAIPAEARPKLIWIGNFADAELLSRGQQEASRLGVDFELRTLVPEAELPQLLSEAAALIYTSHLEPFGYAPLEANACGTAVVGIAEGGMRETITSVNGVLVANADPVALGDALRRFTSDLSYATDFGAQAREHVLKCWSVGDATARLEIELRRAITRRQVQTASMNVHLA